jgi:general secretion pathway protein C
MQRQIKQQTQQQAQQQIQRIPRLISFILFLGLCASLAYWAIEFFTPSPRPVALSATVTQPLPPVSVAAALFGEQADANTMTNIQLRGVILAGRAEESVAILITDGGTPKYLRRDAEVMPGVQVKEIDAKKVVLSDHGVSREVSLAAFVPAASMVAGQANTNLMPMSPSTPALTQATGNLNEAGLSAGQNSNSAGASGNAGATVSGNGYGSSNGGNNVRPSAPANAAAAAPQIAPQNAMPRLQQELPRLSPQESNDTRVQ